MELKAPQEGAWKLAEYTAYHKDLILVVSKYQKALLKIAHKAHPEIHAYLIDLQMYQLTWMANSKQLPPKDWDYP